MEKVSLSLVTAKQTLNDDVEACLGSMVSRQALRLGKSFTFLVISFLSPQTFHIRRRLYIGSALSSVYCAGTENFYEILYKH